MPSENNESKWQEGVAFVKGINMFSSNRITQKKMREICENIENEKLKIIEIVRCDNIVFRKRDMHYATVGQKLEKVLSEHFEKPIHVTTRSIKTIRLIR